MRTWRRTLVGILFGGLFSASATAQQATIRIDAAREVHRLSPLLTGACIEDVNHEIYGGIDSQMIFGESFQEPAEASPIEGMTAYGGDWRVEGGVLDSPAGEGNKIVADDVELADGVAKVEVWFNDKAGGNAGFVLRTSQVGVGADRFHGYEIALDFERQIVRLGLHRNDFELLGDFPCEVPTQKWITLEVRLMGATIEIWVDGKACAAYEHPGERSIASGGVGLRQFHRGAKYRNLAVTSNGMTKAIAFQQKSAEGSAVSRMWQPLQAGGAQGKFALVTERPFVGKQSQRVTHSGGDGEVGIANSSLNGWGMHFVGGREYEGEVYVRTNEPCEFWVALERHDGTQLAETKLEATSGEWTKLEFKLTPAETVDKGHFAIKLRKPGSITVGYAFLQPGEWGRFAGLPIRRDVAELLKGQGITVLRYGGSMVNNPEYRWKKMIGPRALRPPYDGHWYDYSTNGWGILDFMSFCEAAGFEYVPTLSMHETPEEMAEFIAYATGDAESTWGRKRVSDGHPEPYKLRYLQLGNEERVDVDFASRFAERARAIWAENPEVQLVVGDFMYDNVIDDTTDVRGAASGISNLDGQRQILEFAREAGHEVWFDVHVWTDGPGRHPSLAGALSLTDALDSLDTGAKFKVVIFEFNANNHDHRRALANALAINAVERDGRIPIALSANCLQPDGQNDNGWDQGLLFLSPTNVWLQPPGYVTQMYSQQFRPRTVACRTDGAELDCIAQLSKDGESLVCAIVNPTDASIPASFDLAGFTPQRRSATVTELSAPLVDVNTEEQPRNVVPQSTTWEFKELNQGAWSVAPRSVTTIVFE